MNDYSEMSDFEINKAVAIKAGHKSYNEDGSYTNDGNNVTVKGNGILGWFNPCNNPSDMWPLIVENKIDVCFIDSASLWTSFGLTKNKLLVESSGGNPLRAAAIVYLMIKDAQ